MNLVIQCAKDLGAIGLIFGTPLALAGAGLTGTVYTIGMTADPAISPTLLFQCATRGKHIAAYDSVEDALSCTATGTTGIVCGTFAGGVILPIMFAFEATTALAKTVATKLKRNRTPMPIAQVADAEVSARNSKWQLISTVSGRIMLPTCVVTTANDHV